MRSVGMSYLRVEPRMVDLKQTVSINFIQSPKIKAQNKVVELTNTPNDPYHNIDRRQHGMLPERRRGKHIEGIRRQACQRVHIDIQHKARVESPEGFAAWREDAEEGFYFSDATAALADVLGDSFFGNDRRSGLCGFGGREMVTGEDRLDCRGERHGWLWEIKRAGQCSEPEDKTAWLLRTGEARR